MNGTISIGIAGWSYPDWKGIVYTHSRMDELAFVSRFVDCIEINSSFYRPPAEKIVRSWLSRTQDRPHFFFTAKLNREITHEGKLNPETVDAFRSGFAPMLEAGRLRHLLAQFRYDFADTAASRKHLECIAAAFGRDFHLVFELRHKSWENPASLSFVDALGAAVCNLDYPTTSNSFDLPYVAVGRDGYFRLHGRNRDAWFDKNAGRDETYNYYYNPAELRDVQQRIGRLMESLQTLTVIANNHYRGAELANAIELKYLIQGRRQPVPRGLLETYPHLEEVAQESID